MMSEHNDIFTDAHGNPRVLFGCNVMSTSARLAEVAIRTPEVTKASGTSDRSDESSED